MFVNPIAQQMVETETAMCIRCILIVPYAPYGHRDLGYIDSGNGSVPDGPRLLPDQMLTFSMDFFGTHIRTILQFAKRVWKIHLIHLHISQGQFSFS